jgi:hypothetical protein
MWSKIVVILSYVTKVLFVVNVLHSISPANMYVTLYSF